MAKKNDNKDEELINKIFELVKDYEGDPNELLTTVTRKVLYYQEVEREELRKKNLAELAKLGKEIFTLCPVCNFIPLSIEVQSYDTWEEVIDFDRIWESCCDYLCDEEDNDEGLIMPYQDDDMTFGGWKKVEKLWKEMIKLAGYKNHTDNDGDYCEEYHVSVNGFSKDSNEIEWHGDINR